MKGLIKAVLMIVETVAIIHCSGCVTIYSNAHRGQITNFPTNCVPETINIENMQEGGSATAGDITGARVK